MKRICSLLVASLVLLTASSIQAAEAGFQVFSQVPGQRLHIANDSHFSLVNADGQKVAEGANNWNVTVDVPAGEYNLVVEQNSTNFAGSLNVVIGEENEIALLKLDRNGLSLITDAHVCPKMQNPEGVHHHEMSECEHDRECICHRVNEECDPDGAYLPKAAPMQSSAMNTIPNAQLPTSTPALPQVPSYGAAGYGSAGAMGGGMGSLAILGAIGAVIAIAVTDDDHPEPVSCMYRYRR